jgi:hypothetical protein
MVTTPLNEGYGVECTHLVSPATSVLYTHESFFDPYNFLLPLLILCIPSHFISIFQTHPPYQFPLF